MAKISAYIDAICSRIHEKVKVKYNYDSPEAKELKKEIKNLEGVLVGLNVFPSNWTHKSGIGQGKLATVMWIVFLPPGQTTQDGIYVSFCFGKAGNGLVTY